MLGVAGVSAFEHGPGEPRTLAADSSDLDPEHRCSFQVAGNRDIARVERAESKVGRQGRHYGLCTRIVSAQKHDRAEIAVTRIPSVGKVFVAVRVEGFYDMGGGSQPSNLFSAG